MRSFTTVVRAEPALTIKVMMNRGRGHRGNYGGGCDGGGLHGNYGGGHDGFGAGRQGRGRGRTPARNLT